MINPKSLSFQAASIRHVLSLAPDDDVRNGLIAAIGTIEKVNAASGPIRAVLEVFRVFPDARIAGAGDGDD